MGARREAAPWAVLEAPHVGGQGGAAVDRLSGHRVNAVPARTYSDDRATTGGQQCRPQARCSRHRPRTNTVDSRSLDVDSVRGWDGWSWPCSVFGAFDGPLAHLPLDDGRVGSQATGVELVREDLLGDERVLLSLPPGGKGPCWHGRCGATTSHEGQAIGIDTSGQGSVVHHAPDGVVREQQPIHLLQHTVRALRAQHRAWATLMRLRFIQGSGFSGWVAIRRRGCCCTSCAGRWFALVGGRWVASWRSMRPSSVGARGLGRPVGVWGTRAWW